MLFTFHTLPTTSPGKFYNVNCVTNMAKSDINNDSRIILTLDAGGTNLVFSAIQGNKEIVQPRNYSTNASDLDKCLHTIIEGFREVYKLIPHKAAAISFAFPGPADYRNGIIGDLPNFPAFKGGVALGPMLMDEFEIPVFINNDGNLFAYGEALCGFLPELNARIISSGGIKQFKNLIGLTIGTGFGCGVVIDKMMLLGDNSNDTGIHQTLNKFNPQWNAEESVSTRAIQRVYAQHSGHQFLSQLMPKDIFDIAMGEQEGNVDAAKEAFRQFGEALGSSIANIVALIDGVVVIGGGIAAAWPLYAPAMFKEIYRQYKSWEETLFNRLDFEVYNLEEMSVFPDFALGRVRKIRVPYSNREIQYDECARVGIGLSKLGASKAIALGAYAYALQQLDS